VHRDHVLRGRWFRVLKPRYAHEPLSGEGAKLVGGRFNRPGRAALYLSADPQTAYAEYTQTLYDRPGLMCSYDVDLAPVVDLTDADILAALGVPAADLAGRWLGIPDPPSQRVAERLVAEGWAGALYRSAQRPEGTNLVAWRWTDTPPCQVSLADRLAEAPTRPLGG
jgi:RES domain-containing protein